MNNPTNSPQWYSFLSSNITRLLTAIALIIAACAAPSLRHAVCYNLLPLCAIGCGIALSGRISVNNASLWTLAIITVFAAAFHTYNLVHFGVGLEFDSKEYLSLGQSVAAGNGLSGSAYRAPLYPALIGLLMMVGDHSGLYVVILQHATLVLCVPAVYKLSRMHGFSGQSACIASGFMALNSLLMHAASFVMTEILFCALSLLALATLRRLYTSPSLGGSLAAGASFAAATYCRPLLFPVLAFGLLAFFLKKGKRGVLVGSVALIAYFGATAPWELRNLTTSGHYAMSAGLGVQAFTKAITFRCLDSRGLRYKRIEQPLLGVMKDMGIAEAGVAPIPEDDWKTNRIPHALMDSLTTHHGLSYFSAAELLRAAAFEGFAAHPKRYMSSIARSCITLLVSYREIHPSVGQIAPISPPPGYPMLQRILNGMVHVSGYCLLLFPFAALVRGAKNGALFIPFAVTCGMYFLTASIQIGFTRYTIPWLPLTAICAAYVVETILIEGNKISCFIAKKFVQPVFGCRNRETTL
jgi:hypothetical protein